MSDAPPPTGTPRPTDADPAGDLALALRLADVADAVTLPRFGAADLRVERKPDRTPVTDADVACEDAIRAALGRERPDDQVLGEERGGPAEGADPRSRIWIVDPIDGTKNFSRGVGVWATLIALVVDGRPRAAVVSAPALGRRWWASTGGGAFTADGPRGIDVAPIAVSGIADLADAYISTTDLGTWRELGTRDRWLGLVDAAWESRAFGDFHQHCLVAEGVLDVCVEPAASAWDLAAPRLVVEEAGGRFTDLAGTATHDGGSALASNGRLHDAALGLVGTG